MLLKAEGVSFSYLKGSKAKPILDNMDFQIEEGEVVGLWGSSGCGKSTLAKILAGHLKPTKGTVTWGGTPLPMNEYCPVQLLFQHPERAINPRWRMGRTLRESWDPPEELLHAAGIEPAWFERFPNELSGGEQQRFCIVRALGPKTRILICDEMSTMLDVITQAQLWSLVLDQARERGMGLVVITHSEALAERLCDRVVEM